MQVLQKGIAQQVVVRGVADDGRDGGQPRLLDGPPPAFTHDQFVRLRTPVLARAHDNGLENPEFLDRKGQLGELVLVEDLARLLAVGVDVLHRDFRKSRAWDIFQVFPLSLPWDSRLPS